MNEFEAKNELSKFINKRRKADSRLVIKNSQDSASLHNIPWYKRPLDKNEFKHKLAKNGRYYVRHQEWSDRVWIGPYRDISDVNAIIESYVVESLKNTLDKKYNESIHSVIVDNPAEFF